MANNEFRDNKRADIIDKLKNKDLSAEKKMNLPWLILDSFSKILDINPSAKNLLEEYSGYLINVGDSVYNVIPTNQLPLFSKIVSASFSDSSFHKYHWVNNKIDSVYFNFHPIFDIDKGQVNKIQIFLEKIENELKIKLYIRLASTCCNAGYY